MYSFIFQLTASELKCQVDYLSDLLLHPWLMNSAAQFVKLKGVLKDLLDSLVKHHKYLANMSAASAFNKQKKEPVRGYQENWSVQHIAAMPLSSINVRYQDLHRSLQVLDCYELCNLSEFLPDNSSYARKLWLEGLQLQYPLSLYSFSHGNSLGTIYLVWKVDANQDQSAEINMLAKIRDLLPFYSTRAMRKEFMEAFSSSGDDTDLVWDLRQNNGRVKDPRFNPFWEELDRMLDEMSAMHERRQNDVGYLAHFISVSDLRQQVLGRLPANTPAPSISWIQYLKFNNNLF